MKNRLLSVALVAILGVAASPRSWSAEPVTSAAPAPNPPAAVATGHPTDPAEVAADALVVRPVGFAATVVGAAIFVVALPFAAISGDVHNTGKALVGAPAKFTFQRRLGEF